jgi:hypothetical protein
VKQLAKSVQELHDPATIDVLLLLNIEIREALFMNLTQIKSDQLRLVMERHAFIPTALLYLLTPKILAEEREYESLSVSILGEVLSEQQLRKYMDKFALDGSSSAMSFLLGHKRLISLCPMAKWVTMACSDSTINLDKVKWELVLEKPIAHSENSIEKNVSTGKTLANIIDCK